MTTDVADASGMSIISKAERVLRAVATMGSASAAALASHLDEPVSSVYRLLGNLERIGWLEKAETRGQFRLGVDIIGIGHAVMNGLDLRKLTRPELELLHQRSQESAYLCVRRDTRAVCIERVDGEGVQPLELPLGGSMALHRGAGPRVLLAYADAAFRDTYLESLSTGGQNPFTDADRQRLEADLAEIRKSGLAVADGDITPGALAISGPVFNHRQQVVASITVSGLRPRMLNRGFDIQAAVRQAASTVSEALGWETQNAG